MGLIMKVTHLLNALSFEINFILGFRVPLSPWFTFGYKIHSLKHKELTFRPEN